MSLFRAVTKVFPIEDWAALEHAVDPCVFEEPEAPLDVVVCTYNSERFLAPCLESIVANVPVNKLFVVDNFSLDHTVEIAKSFGADVVQTRGSLAEARRLSFGLVTTPFFVNVDSDVVLAKDWFRQIKHYWQGGVGCVWGVTEDQHPLHKQYMRSMWRIRKAESYNIPHLPNMIAKKSVVADVVFPLGILGGSVANEDWFIKFWIEQKGLKCVTAPVVSKHYSFPPQINKSVWYGASSRVSGLETLRNLVLRFVLAVPQGIYAGVCSGDARVILYWLNFRFRSLYGYLNYKRFYNFKREAKV